jgi:phage regulator Rha-like protein
MSIVIIKDGDAVTTTLAIAQGCEVDHASVIKLVRTYLSDLDEFGPVGFEIHVVKRTQGGGTPTEYAILNEQQSTLLLTYMRNSEIVRAFKKKLVRDFWEMVQQRSQSFAIPKTRAEAMRLAADLEEQNAVLALENQQQAQTIASLENLFMTGETPTQFCKRLNGVNCSRVNSSLLALGWLWNAATEENSKPRYRVASRVRDRYLTERPRKISSEGNDPFIKYDLVLLIDGARRLHQFYVKGELSMKSKWDGLYTQAKYNGSDAQ